MVVEESVRIYVVRRRWGIREWAVEGIHNVKGIVKGRGHHRGRRRDRGGSRRTGRVVHVLVVAENRQHGSTEADAISEVVQFRGRNDGDGCDGSSRSRRRSRCRSCSRTEISRQECLLKRKQFACNRKHFKKKHLQQLNNKSNKKKTWELTRVNEGSFETALNRAIFSAHFLKGTFLNMERANKTPIINENREKNEPTTSSACLCAPPLNRLQVYNFGLRLPDTDNIRLLILLFVGT